MAGEEGARDCMLSSPIILYDYPQIAPESAGDLFDGTEIDEILTLRIMTLTDEEKREMRGVDERARRILERTETLPLEGLMKLHGAMRSPRPAREDEQ
jgi:hydrogenase maturation protease